LLVFKLLPDVSVEELAEKGFGAGREDREAGDVIGRSEMSASIDVLLDLSSCLRLINLDWSAHWLFLFELRWSSHLARF